MRISSWLTPIARTSLALGMFLTLCVAPGAALADGRAPATAEAFPVGDWNILANGFEGILHVASVDDSGNLSGSVFGGPIKGFWNGRARRVTFTTTVASSELQVYTGYLFSKGSTALAGTFEAFSGTGATAKRNVYAWQAVAQAPYSSGTVKLSTTYTSLAPLSLYVDANGSTGTLTITSVDPQGNVTGTIFGNAIQGFWDGYQQKLTFIRFEDMSDASRQQVYTGYYSTGAMTVLAGSFEAFAGATAQRAVYGWYATKYNLIPQR